MKTKEFFTAIASNETLSEDLRNFATASLEKLDKANASRATKLAEKKAVENAPIIEAITAYLNENKGAHLASEIASAVNVSVPKAIAMCNKIDGIVKGEQRVGSRIVTTYSL